MIRKIILIILIGFIMALSINTAIATDNITMDTTLKSSNADADTGLKTFTDLSNEIKNAKPDSQVHLKGTYKYDKKTDALLKNGVWITKDITIVGQKGCTIDGSSLARCFNVKKDCRLQLENVKIKNGYTTENGAGVKLYSNSKLIIKNCAFENNIAKNSNGGAIEAKKSCTIKIYSSSSKNNKATSTTKSLGDDKRGMGSVIKTSVGTTLVIKDSKFSSNEAFLSMILVVSESGKFKKKQAQSTSTSAHSLKTSPSTTAWSTVTSTGNAQSRIQGSAIITPRKEPEQSLWNPQNTPLLKTANSTRTRAATEPESTLKYTSIMTTQTSG